MKKYNYSRRCVGFDLGDEVETIDGKIGKITFICPCEKCAEQGFFDVSWETIDGKYSGRIDAEEVNAGLPHYRRIGNQVLEYEPFCIHRRQMSLHQLLYRKLLNYVYDNEFEDEEWNGTNMHAYIIYNFTRKDYDIRWTRDEKEPGTVYFKTPTRATAALNEVVMPFVKEHPDFVW